MCQSTEEGWTFLLEGRLQVGLVMGGVWTQTEEVCSGWGTESVGRGEEPGTRKLSSLIFFHWRKLIDQAGGTEGVVEEQKGRELCAYPCVQNIPRRLALVVELPSRICRDARVECEPIGIRGAPCGLKEHQG